MKPRALAASLFALSLSLASAQGRAQQTPAALPLHVALQSPGYAVLEWAPPGERAFAPLCAAPCEVLARRDGLFRMQLGRGRYPLQPFTLPASVLWLAVDPGTVGQRNTGIALLVGTLAPAMVTGWFTVFAIDATHLRDWTQHVQTVTPVVVAALSGATALAMVITGALLIDRSTAPRVRSGQGALLARAPRLVPRADGFAF